MNVEQTRRLTSEPDETPLHVLETLPGAFFFLDDAEIIVYANASARALIGVPLEALRGTSFWRGAPQLVSVVLYQTVHTTRRTREPVEVEYLSPMTRSWLHAQLAPTARGLLLQFHEKKEPTRSQETFFPGCSLTTDILDTIYVGVCFLTPAGILLEINEAPLANAQLRREEVIGHPFAETPWWTSYPASQEQLRAAIQRASRGETVRFETQIHPREGLDPYIEVTITPHRDIDHQVAYLVFVGSDITTRKHTEEAIYTLVDTLPQLVWVAQPDGYDTYFNRRLLDYLAMTPEQAEGTGWQTAVHVDDRQRVFAVWQAAVQTGAFYEVELRLRDGTSGAYRWFLARGVPQRNAQGAILHWMGTCTDIEERKRLEEALRQSQERVSVLMNSTIIGMVIFEGEQIIDANDTFLNMTGYTREDLRAGRMNWLQMTAPEDRDQAWQAYQEMLKQRTLLPYEKEYICKDGSRLSAIMGGILFQGHPCQGIGFILDNSARKELEQRKDAFISMASHELRNPLTALKLQTTLLRRQLAKQGTLASAPALASMEAQIKTIIRLVEELLDVSKIQAGKLEYVRESVDLDELLREVADTMQQIYPSHRILVCGATRTRLMGDRDRLGQVFTNLLSNAIKYSPGAETVEMKLSTSQEAIMVQVRDHGLGIPREQCDKIFERFYRVTTQKQKAIAGLGMGLYIVAEVVKHYGGKVVVDSVVGEGSTFTVILPL